jgi:sulfur-carrier protein adenylyltransferase/sulfurtransferase
MHLNQEQLARYREQLSVPGMTRQAQARLLDGRVLILGANALAGATSRNLIEVGIGSVQVVDESDGALKEVSSIVAQTSATAFDTKFSTCSYEFGSDALELLMEEFDVVVDSAEDWQHKLLMSDICMSTGKPLIHAGVIGFRFHIYSMLPGKSACLRCALPMIGIDEVPLEPPVAGMFGPVSELVGAWQAIETVKLIGSLGATQGNELFKFDCLSGEFEVVRGLDPQRDCPDCQ